MDIRVWLYSPWDLSDAHAWSGVVPRMVDAIESLAAAHPHMQVHHLDPVRVPDHVRERLLARARGTLLRKRALPQHTAGTARLRSQALRHQLERRRSELGTTHGPDDARPTTSVIDVVVAIAASTDVIDLPPDVRLIQVTDATFHAIVDFYPMFQGLGRRGTSQGKLVERRSARGTDHYLVASQWAADSLVHDVGVGPPNVTVAPFGPGICPSEQAHVSSDLVHRPLRVLCVCSDWQRKGGDRAVAIIQRLRQLRPVDFTVVGQTPDGLPPWVATPGRLSPWDLAVEYSTHDVLLDPALANAAGVVMTDALHAGLPVVAAGVGGVRSIVEHGRTGWIVPVGESAPLSVVQQRFVDVLASLDHSMVRQASVQARLDAQLRLTWEQWGRQLCALLDRLAAQHPEGLQRRAVMITPVLPAEHTHESAGDLLVWHFYRVLSGVVQTMVIVPQGPAALRVVSRGDAAPHRMVPSSCVRVPMRRWHAWVQRVTGIVPALPDRVWGRRHGYEDLHSLVAAADVIDLQWEEQGALIPQLRRVNPTARIVITLHDVLSQRYARQSRESATFLRTIVWWGRAVAARRLERQILRTADHVVVLSQKDARLLPRPYVGSRRSGATVHVIAPALVATMRHGMPSGAVDGVPRLLFVGYLARWENEDGLVWFARDVLPLVRRHFPKVQCVAAGAGHRPPVVAALEDAGVELLGFVDNLEAEYARADAVVVPLRLGAGVKFKVVDALLRAVPVVTTSVGMEGIGDDAWAACVADSAQGLADGLLTVLRDPESANQHARRVAPQVAEVFGAPPFEDAVRRLYS
ncbi:MAG: glycosyltransferase [Kocuria sp.]|nr:glycosyltransferase [Kocuria sp.]